GDGSLEDVHHLLRLPEPREQAFAEEGGLLGPMEDHPELVVDLGLGAVEESREEPRPRDAVGERVMNLEEQREAASLEALDDPQLPEGPVPIDGARVDAGDEVPERVEIRARRQGGVADVMD